MKKDKTQPLGMFTAEELAATEVHKEPAAESETSPAPRHQSPDAWIDDLVGAICDPIIVWPSPWQADIPDRLLEQVKIERLLMNIKAAHGERMTATDAEALAYMFPRTLEAPVGHDWTEIYMYLGTKVFSAVNGNFPEDIRRDKLTDYQIRMLNDLKNFIYHKRLQARKERARARRHEEKAEEEKPQTTEATYEQMPLM